MYFDVVVAGGSIAGLICAREIADTKNTVLVIEDDYEIGTPEHCGGLVSSKGLEKLGIIPSTKIFNHQIESAEIHFPNKKSMGINTKRQRIIEINRRELDKQIAHQATKNGAKIRVKTSFLKHTKEGILTNEGEIKCKIFVDARGVTTLVQKDRTGIMSAIQYEVYADWIKKGKVEIFLDQKKYPGFFAWIIPSSEGKGKVGIAGKGIKTTEAIEEFLEGREYSVIRKVFAPIWIKGPIKRFVDENIVIIGDAAGQTKPTTAGGIYSCGMGGLLAGKAISQFLKSNDKEDLEKYQKDWNKIFGDEFEKQIQIRNILDKLDNDTINKFFNAITPEIVKEISEKEDFDFHTGAIIRLLGIKGSIKTAHALISNEIKKLLR